MFASGTIEAEEVTVAAEMGGRIVAILADEGDEVAAGDVLIELDKAMLLAEREQAEDCQEQGGRFRRGDCEWTTQSVKRSLGC